MKLGYCILVLMILQTSFCKEGFISQNSPQEIEILSEASQPSQNESLISKVQQIIQNQFGSYFEALSSSTLLGEPLICAQGTYYDSYYNRCVACPFGRYQNEIGKTSCILCPNGFKCPDASSLPIPCEPGTSRQNGSILRDVSKCDPCEMDRYSDQPGQETCKRCPDGYKCPGGKVAIPCEPGTSRQNSSIQRDASQCDPCETRTYQNESGKSTCFTCPNGFKCPDRAQLPIPCEPGTSRQNTSILRDASKCDPCEMDRYSDQPGSETCKRCPEGYKCPYGKEAILCEPGTSRQNYSIQTDTQKCDPCEMDRYSDEPGQVTCKRCPEGYKCPGGKIPIPCEPGTSRQNYSTQRDASQCDECETGTYSNQSGQATCKRCPDGNKCPGGKVAIPCEPGTFRENSSYYRDATDCEVCGIGRFQDQPGQSKCVICPEGHMCPFIDQLPIPCSPGTYRSNGSYYRDATECDKCSSGTYQNLFGQNFCRSCPYGYSCLNASQEPVKKSQ